MAQKSTIQQENLTAKPGSSRVQQKRLGSKEAALKKSKRRKKTRQRLRRGAVATATSIVSVGVPEATSTSMFERSVADINAVNKLIVCVDSTSPPVAAYRLGRQREDGKPRLLKIVFSSTFALREVLEKVLEKAYKLQSFRTTDGRFIFLRPYMSREELVQYHEIRRKNFANPSPATNANAMPLKPHKDTPTSMVTYQKKTNIVQP
uniref:Uncharacterized protein n=1 Tax=Caenorhabditis japonica TaxID=281687 RepID=A0A8R1E4B5_CAEJA